MFKLEDKAAVITGAGRGIGRSIALAFAEQGADLILAARTESQLEAVAAEVREFGRRAVVVPTDVQDIDALRAAIDRCVTEFGKLDILVNNAGGGAGAGGFGLLIDVTEEGYDGLFNLNDKSPLFGMQHACRIMRDQGHGGAIVNIVSIDGLTPAPQEALYGSAKAALSSQSVAMAVEVGQYGIRVNAIAPALIDTPLVARGLQTDEDRMHRSSYYPLNRVGKPEDVAALAVFFASPEAEWISGQSMLVAGGTHKASDVIRFLHEVNPLPPRGFADEG